MTVITVDEIKKVARLARLHVDEKDIQTHSQSLSRIFDLIAEINSKDTKDIQPMTSPLQDAKLPLRPDRVTATTDQRDLLQQLAPNVTEGLYIVPKVLE